MEGLDLLKQGWNNENRFRKIPKDELYDMAQKKSKSVMKWILLVSVIEFSLWFLIPFSFSNDTSDEGSQLVISLGLDVILDAISYFHYVVMIGFMVLFYRNYKKIQLKDSSRKLMGDILRVRKTIMYYINVTIFLIILRCIVSFWLYFTKDPKMVDLFERLDKADKLWIMVLIIAVIALIVFGAIALLVWGYFKLVYGLLMKKLYSNYEDLKKNLG